MWYLPLNFAFQTKVTWLWRCDPKIIMKWNTRLPTLRRFHQWLGYDNLTIQVPGYFPHRVSDCPLATAMDVPCGWFPAPCCLCDLCAGHWHLTQPSMFAKSLPGGNREVATCISPSFQVPRQRRVALTTNPTRQSDSFGRCVWKRCVTIHNHTYCS